MGIFCSNSRKSLRLRLDLVRTGSQVSVDFSISIRTSLWEPPDFSSGKWIFPVEEKELRWGEQFKNSSRLGHTLNSINKGGEQFLYWSPHSRGRQAGRQAVD